jgi:hypothetical protein
MLSVAAMAGIHNSEGRPVFHLAFGIAHDGRQAVLRTRLGGRAEHEAHTASGHAPQHPKAPEIVRKFSAHAIN